MKNTLNIDKQAASRINLMPAITTALSVSGDGYTTIVNTLDVLRWTEEKDYRRGTPLRTRLRYVAALFGSNPHTVAPVLLMVAGTNNFHVDELVDILRGHDEEPTLQTLNCVYEEMRKGTKLVRIEEMTGATQSVLGRAEKLFGFRQRLDDLVFDAAMRAYQRGLSGREAQAAEPLLAQFGTWNVNKLLRKAHNTLIELGEIAGEAKKIR